MTIQEAHTLWGRKADHSLTFMRTRDVFERGFKILDLSKATSFYGKKELATALAYSDLTKEEKPVAASVMFHILNFAHEASPNQQGPINFAHTDLLSYEPVAPATDPAEPASVLGTRKSSLTPNPNTVANGDSLPFVGPEAHSVAPLKTPVAPVGEGSDETNGNVNVNLNVQPSDISHQASESQTTKRRILQTTNNKTTKKNMNRETNNFCQTAKAVRSIEPITGSVAGTYESIAEAQRRTGIKNIYRAIETGGTAGGYEWEYVNGPAHSIDNGQLTIDNSNDKPQPSATRPQTSVSQTAKPTLSDITDQELIAEIKRRGWKGNIEIVMRVEL